MLDRCERCAGIWFDHGELEAVVGTKVTSRLDPARPGGGDGPSGRCPRCNVEMVPYVAAQDPARPVRVDRCPSCLGLWLDRKRLQVVEDRRVPLAVRELCLGAGADEQIVAALPEGEGDLLRRTSALLENHPQRTALLAYLERGTEGRGSEG